MDDATNIGFARAPESEGLCSEICGRQHYSRAVTADLEAEARQSGPEDGRGNARSLRFAAADMQKPAAQILSET